MVMKKTILAATVGAMLVVAVFLTGMSNNAVAQVSAESRVMQTMKSLTNIAQQLIIEVDAKNADIINDLALKKKFFEISTGSFSSATSTGISLTCDFPGVQTEQSACAFHIRMLKCTGSPEVDVVSVTVDGVTTDVTEKLVTVPGQFLIDSGINEIGASESVSIEFGSVFSGECIFAGEKPQGGFLTVTP